jgi:hypothetical protein
MTCQSFGHKYVEKYTYISRRIFSLRLRLYGNLVLIDSIYRSTKRVRCFFLNWRQSFTSNLWTRLFILFENQSVNKLNSCEMNGFHVIKKIPVTGCIKLFCNSNNITVCTGNKQKCLLQNIVFWHPESTICTIHASAVLQCSVINESAVGASTYDHEKRLKTWKAKLEDPANSFLLFISQNS